MLRDWFGSEDSEKLSLAVAGILFVGVIPKQLKVIKAVGMRPIDDRTRMNFTRRVYQMDIFGGIQISMYPLIVIHVSLS